MDCHEFPIHLPVKVDSVLVPLPCRSKWIITRIQFTGQSCGFSNYLFQFEQLEALPVDCSAGMPAPTVDFWTFLRIIIFRFSGYLCRGNLMVWPRISLLGGLHLLSLSLE